MEGRRRKEEEKERLSCGYSSFEELSWRVRLAPQFF